jgi:hypothetical protein
MQQLVGQHVQEWRCGCAQYPRYPVPSTWYLVPGTQYLVPQLQRGRLYNPQLIPSIAANRIEATQPKDGQPNIGTIPGSLLSVVRDLGRNCLAAAMPGALRPLMPRPVPVAPVFLTTAGCGDMLFMRARVGMGRPPRVGGAAGPSPPCCQRALAEPPSIHAGRDRMWQRGAGANGCGGCGSCGDVRARSTALGGRVPALGGCDAIAAVLHLARSLSLCTGGGGYQRRAAPHLHGESCSAAVLSLAPVVSDSPAHLSSGFHARQGL